MGTMNLLGRDLGLVGDLELDVRALHTGHLRVVDMATLNGVPFHSASGLGFAVIVAHERERARRRIPFSLVLATIVAAVRALIRTRPIEVEVEVDGRRVQLVADAVLVTNNVFEGSPWRRPRLDEGILEVHLLAAPGFVARTRAALAVMTGEWRALRHLTSLRGGQGHAATAGPRPHPRQPRRRGHPAAGCPRLRRRAPGAAYPRGQPRAHRRGRPCHAREPGRRHLNRTGVGRTRLIPAMERPRLPPGLRAPSPGRNGRRHQRA